MVTVLHLHEYTFAYIVIHMQTGLGFEGYNAEVLARVRLVIALLNLPFLLIGDMQNPPQDLEDIGWPKSLKAQIVVPSNVDYTCTMGSKRVNDYVVISDALRPLVESCVATRVVPWKPHFMLTLVLKVALKQVRVRVLKLAPPLLKGEAK